ncbi:hypothetical protein BUALT_Bualt16G0065800 [Buddleja alternifolia]|uniref:Ninja-family protein n=1 Tax=Buddleja alternifolia TaxID=168488 RepID=A0AAV6W9K9_9LAMI|nr:hypothetical protein BUALT_Bualt16G0065800 [Buddleja alternifolia]
MEDEKSLDLSLSLPCGGSSSLLKDKYGSSSDIRSDEGDRGSKIINEFKNFLEGGTQSGVGEKRKNLFIDTNQEKKHERETNHPDLTDKSKTSHISITTDEGSTAENEDVADSEVDGSTSRQVPQPDDVSKRFVSSGSLTRAEKEIHDFGNSSGVEILGQKRFTISSEKEFNAVNVPVSYGVPFSAQPVNMNMSYSQPVKDSNGTPSLSGYPLPGMMHAMAPTNGDRTGTQPVGSANYPLMFGYTPVQLPALDRDNSRGIVSTNQIAATYSGRNTVNPDTLSDSRNLTQATLPVHKSSESTPYDGRAVEHGKGNGKQRIGEGGSSSHKEVDHMKDESIPCEFPAIRPGIAAELKFGGCGTYPNLPWVSTTGSGPNGRTISGVTYRYSPTQIRIVCACHGSHMSPEEFVHHATEENTTPDGLPSFTGTNPAASAPS